MEFQKILQGVLETLWEVHLGRFGGFTGDRGEGFQWRYMEFERVSGDFRRHIKVFQWIFSGFHRRYMTLWFQEVSVVFWGVSDDFRGVTGSLRGFSKKFQGVSEALQRISGVYLGNHFKGDGCRSPHVFWSFK